MAYTIRFNAGPTFTFLTMVTPNGLPLSIARLVQEPLETPGVNGRRWRTVNRQHRQFELRALAEAADVAAAGALANSYLDALSSNQTVTLTDGATNLESVHVTDCEPVAIPGQVVSPLAGANSLASVVSVWQLTYTYFNPGAA